MARYLIQNGACVYHVVSIRAHISHLHWILVVVAVSATLFVFLYQEEDGYTGLHHAAKLGNLEIVNMLLETGQVDVNAQVGAELLSSTSVTKSFYL